MTRGDALGSTATCVVVACQRGRRFEEANILYLVCGGGIAGSRGKQSRAANDGSRAGYSPAWHEKVLRGFDCIER